MDLKPSKGEWIFASLIFVILLARYVYPQIVAPMPTVDFDVCYYTAQHALSGGHELYSKSHSPIGAFAKYAPFWTLTFSPFALLPNGISSNLYLVFISFLYSLMFLLSSSILRSYRLPTGALLFPLVLAFLWRPLLTEMAAGQANIVLSCVLLMSIVAYRRKRPILSAALLSYAISIKLPALIFLCFPAMRRDFKSVGYVIGFFLLTNITAAYLFYPAHPFSLLSDWLRLLYSSGHELLFRFDIQSLYAAVGTYFGTKSPFGLNILNLSTISVKTVTVFIGIIMFLPLLFFSRQFRENEILILSLLWILMECGR
jgi:hypothetical protein